MPTPARILRERNHRGWDDLIADAAQNGRHGQEHVYYGIASQERAADVRSKLRTAGRHENVAVRSYWCPSDGSCMHGEHQGCSHGDQCAFHVYYTIYDIEEARQYKAAAAAQQGAPAR